MSKIITSLALLSIGIVGYAQDTPPTGRVGINTTTPKGTLEIAAPRNDSKGLLDTKNNGVVIPTLTKAEVASLTKPVNGTLIFVDDASGEASTAISNTTSILEKGFYYYVYTGNNTGTWISPGSTYSNTTNGGVSIAKPLSGVNIIKYAARAWGDWIANLNTNIDSERYDMSVLSAVLLGAEIDFNHTGPGEVPKISAFEEGKTWRIKADFDSFNTKDGRNGTWVFYVMVTPKGTIKYIETTTSEGASNTHNISEGLPDIFKRK